jgi:MFS family permease
VFAGLVLEIVGVLGMAAGRNVAVLVAARTVMGLGAGVAIPAARRIVILADPDNLGSNIGRLLAADVAGFAMGPAISAVLVGPFGIPAPFLLIGFAIVCCLPVVLRVHVDEADRADATQARFAFDLLRHRSYVGALCLGAAGFVMIGTFDALWVLVLDDLDTADWIANLGITLFALPLIFLGAIGGRLAYRRGPFKVGAIGLLLGAAFMFSYGQWASGGAMFAIAMFHSISDGLTISSAGVAVGMVAPKLRQAGAQGLLGGVQTLIGGIAALVGGALYDGRGRAVAYTVCAVSMALLVGAGLVFAGRSIGQRLEEDEHDLLSPPATV